MGGALLMGVIMLAACCFCSAASANVLAKMQGTPQRMQLQMQKTMARKTTIKPKPIPQKEPEPIVLNDLKQESIDANASQLINEELERGKKKKKHGPNYGEW